MKKLIGNQKGSALVTTLFFLLGLAVTGAIIVGIASSEKRVTFNDYTHVRSVNSSDAGGEEAINWIRNIASTSSMLVPKNTQVFNQASFTNLPDIHVSGEDNRYRYNVTFTNLGPAEGYSSDYTYFYFRINSTGASSQDSEAAIEVGAQRLMLVNASNHY